MDKLLGLWEKYCFNAGNYWHVSDMYNEFSRVLNFKLIPELTLVHIIYVVNNDK